MQKDAIAKNRAVKKSIVSVFKLDYNVGQIVNAKSVKIVKLKLKIVIKLRRRCLSILSLRKAKGLPSLSHKGNMPKMFDF